MSEEQLLQTRAASKWLHNVGAPMSRVQWVPVDESLLKNCGVLKQEYRLSLKLPADMENPADWVLQLAGKLGLPDFAAIDRAIRLPAKKMIVQPPDRFNDFRPLSEMETLRTALILSQCNSFTYLPKSPHIFTLARLNRSIRLVTIKTDTYYELD